jgi:hypothetical protein
MQGQGFVLQRTSELEEKTASGGRLSGVDVTTDNDGKMLLALRHFCLRKEKVVIVRCFPVQFFTADEKSLQAHECEASIRKDATKETRGCCCLTESLTCLVCVPHFHENREVSGGRGAAS